MNVAVICRSASNGGAAIVSRRLTEALRSVGVDATLLVVEEDHAPFPLTPFTVKARYPILKPLAFLAERGRIFISNGFSTHNLWKTDAGDFGLPLWRHPVVKKADAVILNYVNQGTLSLRGIGRIAGEGKRILWTMHDMWPFTGVCHHAMECRRFESECGCCPLLGHHDHKPHDLSHRTWLKKNDLYWAHPISFVAVSSWLRNEAARSSLLRDRNLELIPNPFNPILPLRTEREGDRKRILFAAARLDNWIKGLDTLKKAVEIMGASPNAGKIEIVLAGGVKNRENLEGFALPTIYMGNISSEKEMADIYGNCHAVVNCSSFENLPGTIIEGQAYGAVPVAFDRGGQKDIIAHLFTGYLAEWSDSPDQRAANISRGLIWALEQGEETRRRMREEVEKRFGFEAVARRYLDLISRTPREKER